MRKERKVEVTRGTCARKSTKRDRQVVQLHKRIRNACPVGREVEKRASPCPIGVGAGSVANTGNDVGAQSVRTVSTEVRCSDLVGTRGALCAHGHVGKQFERVVSARASGVAAGSVTCVDRWQQLGVAVFATWCVQQEGASVADFAFEAQRHASVPQQPAEEAAACGAIVKQQPVPQPIDAGAAAVETSKLAATTQTNQR
ncbi:MAG: hypothetical protein QM811_29835 [Pirellulales bacterium]